MQRKADLWPINRVQVGQWSTGLKSIKAYTMESLAAVVSYQYTLQVRKRFEWNIWEHISARGLINFEEQFPILKKISDILASKQEV